MPPVFYIIMGPNGAGKSTFGFQYTNGVPVYDPDRRKIEIQNYLSNLNISQRQQYYPAYTSDMFEEMFDLLVDDYQKEEYKELRQCCTNELADFALETPFADNFGLNEVRYFKTIGYAIHGIFFGLNTVEQSITNVSLRVQKQGHDLPLQSIRWNFTQCYINIQKYIELFDTIVFMDAQHPLASPSLDAKYQKNQLTIYNDRPEWLQQLSTL